MNFVKINAANDFLCAVVNLLRRTCCFFYRLWLAIIEHGQRNANINSESGSWRGCTQIDYFKDSSANWWLEKWFFCSPKRCNSNPIIASFNRHMLQHQSRDWVTHFFHLNCAILIVTDDGDIFVFLRSDDKIFQFALTLCCHAVIFLLIPKHVAFLHRHCKERPLSLLRLITRANKFNCRKLVYFSFLRFLQQKRSETKLISLSSPNEKILKFHKKRLRNGVSYYLDLNLTYTRIAHAQWEWTPST